MRRLTEDGPRIKTNWLTIFVERTREEEAKGVLRKAMGLFPVLAPNEFEDSDGEEGDSSQFCHHNIDAFSWRKMLHAGLLPRQLSFALMPLRTLPLEE